MVIPSIASARACPSNVPSLACSQADTQGEREGGRKERKRGRKADRQRAPFSALSLPLARSLPLPLARSLPLSVASRAIASRVASRRQACASLTCMLPSPCSFSLSPCPPVSVCRHASANHALLGSPITPPSPVDGTGSNHTRPPTSHSPVSSMGGGEMERPSQPLPAAASARGGFLAGKYRNITTYTRITSDEFLLNLY